MGIGPPQEEVGVVPAKISFIHDTAVGPAIAAAGYVSDPTKPQCADLRAGLTPGLL